MFLALIFLLAQGQDLDSLSQPTFDYVLLISIDGLRSDALLVDEGEGLPNFQRLMRGPHTLNARCDPDYSVTLPNHSDMLTGRIVNGPEGHHWSSNATPPADAKLVDVSGALIHSIYHNTSDADIFDAMIASKMKFQLFSQTWNSNSTALIDRVVIRDNANPDAQVDLALQLLDPSLHPRAFVFLHLRAPDDAGHKDGWELTPGSTYMESVRSMDAQLGRIFAALDAVPQRRARTAIVVTADHGGGVPFKNHHGHGMMWVNTIIPFFIDAPGATALDLYQAANLSRQDPGIDPVANQPLNLPPIRNADVANLCLALMGLKSVQGSSENVGQDLAAVIFSALPAATR